jgi:hypothetical protein
MKQRSVKHNVTECMGCTASCHLLCNLCAFYITAQPLSYEAMQHHHCIAEMLGQTKKIGTAGCLIQLKKFRLVLVTLTSEFKFIATPMAQHLGRCIH